MKAAGTSRFKLCSQKNMTEKEFEQKKLFVEGKEINKSELLPMASEALRSGYKITSLSFLPFLFSFLLSFNLLTCLQRQQFIPRRRRGASKLANAAKLRDLARQRRLSMDERDVDRS